MIQLTKTLVFLLYEDRIEGEQYISSPIKGTLHYARENSNKDLISNIMSIVKMNVLKS